MDQGQLLRMQNVKKAVTVKMKELENQDKKIKTKKTKFINENVKKVKMITRKSKL